MSNQQASGQNFPSFIHTESTRSCHQRGSINLVNQLIKKNMVSKISHDKCSNIIMAVSHLQALNFMMSFQNVRKTMVSKMAFSEKMWKSKQHGEFPIGSMYAKYNIIYMVTWIPSIYPMVIHQPGLVAVDSVKSP